MRIEFLREAEIELLEGVVRYEETAIGLGLDFKNEVKNAVQYISSFPNAWSPRDDGTRRFLLNRFPYVVVYCIHESRIFVLGVVCCRKKPKSRQFRIEKIKQNK